MANHRRHKTIPFGERSCSARKKIFIEMKNLIRTQGAPGGLFYTHDYMDGHNGWLDIWFIGKNKTLYNVTLETTRCAYINAVDNAAIEAAEALKTSVFDESKNFGNPFFANDIDAPEFSGRGRYEWIREEERRIADSGEVHVFEELTLHHDYAAGVGLHASIDVPTLTVDNVNAFIRNFIAGGEKAFRGTEALTYSYEDSHGADRPNAIVFPEDRCKSNFVE